MSAPIHPSSCGPRCAHLCTESGLASILATEQALLHWRAFRRLGDTGLAEHAVQETLLRAWRACATYDPARGSVRTWLLSIERNVLTDIVRMRAVRPPETGWDDIADGTETHGARPDFADSVADGLLVDELLARLPDPQRHAVVQVILRDRAYQDVAADLGVPVGTVKTRVHYALQSLRRAPGRGRVAEKQAR
ncbi:RNA polymerase sigma factor [Nocardia sp. alder85J]|uniref:RNA polymerase sigma factor n=1 Tax=Nocardia sp. alder85J TaxID=2862949 RepID=UPI001CD6E862|nr:sigma-70 family RNA polymerase sigma factor [Nocardia sp. alder85J]MCX4095365.1 sigma-70 family RNA polymerase sigma factor [Nocardia sp. alder85J]